MARVLALLPHPAAAERLRLALMPEPRAPHYELAFARAWAELLSQARAHPPDLVVFDPDAADRDDAYEQLAGAHPAVALLPYGRFDGGRARILLRLSLLGVREVVIRGQDDEPPAIRERVRGLLSRRFVDEVADALADLFPGALRTLLEYLLANAGVPLDPARAARSQFCHPKTLRARLRRAGLPSLNRLIVWTRLLHAAHLLAGTGRSVAQVARTMGYPSPAAFRAQVHRYAGICAGQLYGARGMALLQEAFRARVRPAPAEHGMSGDMWSEGEGSGEFRGGSAE